MPQSIDDIVTNGMTDAAWRAASETNAAAIICVTRTGFTVRSIARFRPKAKILGFTTDERALRQLNRKLDLLFPGTLEERRRSYGSGIR